jgi:Trk-type K+ transport system membrane component
MATSKVRLFRPAQIITLAFISLIAAGTSLLSLPFSRVDGSFGFNLDSLFTAISSLCVNGLTVVNTETFWTPIGHLIILLLVKIGGFGIMAFTALLALLVAHKMSLRASMVSSEEHRALASGDIRSVLIRIALVGLVVESIGSALLSFRFLFEYGYSIQDAFWYGTFHSVSAFNNAGMSLFGDSLTGFNHDSLVLLVMSIQVMLGSIGFPVLLEVGRHIYKNVKDKKNRRRFATMMHWSLTSRLVVFGTISLVLLGMLYFGILEWNNDATIGTMSTWQKLLNIFVLSVMPRSAGFNAIDIGGMSRESWLGMDILMFIGGGSGGTAGGLKITTVTVLLFIVFSEIRGARAVNIGKRRLPRSIHRQAITLLFLYSALLIGSVLILQLVTDFSTDELLFEASSALGTAGLSTGITSELSVPAQVLVMFLMFIGRVGPTLVASSLAVKIGKGYIQYPKERPTIG